MGRHKVPLRDARYKYKYNQQRAKKMGAEFNISFAAWYAWWASHGVEKNSTGKDYNKESLVMVRKDDTKPFTLDNIQAMTRGKTNTGRPCRSLGKERPNTWVIKDPVLHKMYIPFLKAKAQTDFRVREGIAVGEWLLTFDDFVAVWGDLWQLRGRASTDFAMCREDFDGDWERDNVIVVTRKEQLSRARDYRESKK
jgi:hypothetical protein